MCVSLLSDGGVCQTALGGGDLHDDHQGDDEGGDAVPHQADLGHVAVTLGAHHVTHSESTNQ